MSDPSPQLDGKAHVVPQAVTQVARRLDAVVAAVGTVLLDKEPQIRLALACMLARGHLLIEDLPGMGKTMLANALARTLSLSSSRIQFTSDTLPADVLGMNFFDRERGQFEFRPGPVFSELVLADEINRTTPRSQSALLEAMEEGQVTVEGETRALPQPFFVIATQNPFTQIGTYPLPESQLDRFLLRLEIGYPAPAAERELLQGTDRRALLRDLPAVMNTEELLGLQNQVPSIRLSPAVLDYTQRLLQHSRGSAEFGNGLSPRAGIGLVRAAQAWAVMAGRDYVLPEDVQAVLPGIGEHRLRPRGSDSSAGETLAQRLLAAVEVIG